MRHLTVPHILAVEPNIEAGIHALKVQICLRCIFIGDIHKIAQISAAGVIHRHIRGIYRERIADVGILVLIITVVLPNTGDGDGVPAACIKALLIKQLFKGMDALAVLELPIAVQQLKAVGMLAVLDQIIHANGSGDEVGAVGSRAGVVSMKVFIISGYDHGGVSSLHLLQFLILFYRGFVGMK